MAAPVGSSSEPKMRVDLRLACAHLARLDVLSKSDPIVVIKEKTASGAWAHVGTTECVKNNSDPEFVQTIQVDYFFEREQHFKFTVFDMDDSSGKSFDGADIIGFAEYTLAELISSPGGCLTKPLSSKGGQIRVHAAEIPAAANEQLTFRFVGSNLDKKDLFGKSDPFFVIRAGAQSVRVFQSEVIKNTLNPVWMPTTISMWTLCQGDRTKSITVEVFDWDKHSDADLIGAATFPVSAMLTPGHSFELINEKKRKKSSSYHNSGVITTDTCVLKRKASFLEFLAGGLEISCAVGVDFTGSNGQVTLPTSLHFQSPYKPNDYIQVLSSVGQVLSYYDSDKLFPAFGFGGKLLNGVVSHDFALNGNEANPYCAGVPGIIQAYQQAITQVALWGPTNFAPIIKKAAALAKVADAGMAAGGKQAYYVLLIITDGVITDAPDAISAIIQASSLPLSIIIVGVGKADFSQMNVLDGDGGPLRTAGCVAARDIVQFVPFNQVAGDPTRLAAEVLAEVPDQVVAYFESKKLAPRAPPAPQLGPMA